MLSDDLRNMHERNTIGNTDFGDYNEMGMQKHKNKTLA